MAKCGRGIQLTLSWVAASDGYVPEDAVNVGDNVYIARARHQNEFIPGKLIPSLGRAFVPYGGAEYAYSQYQVLCETGINCGRCYKWSSAENGEVPKHSVVAAISEDGEPVYIARAEVNGEMAAGKVHNGHTSAYFPYGGIEIPLDQYEVLVWIKKPE